MQVEIIVDIEQALKLSESAFREILHQGMEAAVYRALELVPPYPPYPMDAKSPTRRTMRLGKSLAVLKGRGNPDAESYVESNGKIGWVGTNVQYAKYVIGDAQGKGQVWYHAKRWWRLADVLQKGEPEIIETFTKAIDRLLKNL
jgi:hypothetical protein